MVFRILTFSSQTSSIFSSAFASSTKRSNSQDDSLSNHGNRLRRLSKSQSIGSQSKKRFSIQSIFAPTFMLSTLPQTFKRTPSPRPSIHPNHSIADPRSSSNSSTHLSYSDAEALQFYSPDASPASITFSSPGLDMKHLVSDASQLHSAGFSKKRLSRSMPTRRSSRSVRNSPPPTFLLDKDPFANLSESPCHLSYASSTSPSNVRQTPTPEDGPYLLPPRSPLAPTPHTSTPPPLSPSLISNPGSALDISGQSAVYTAPPTPPVLSQPPLAKPGKSSGHSSRPAYQRPAFAQRPSMPSLHTLAEVNVVIPKKVCLPDVF
jgi:hypothetical protein